MATKTLQVQDNKGYEKCGEVLKSTSPNNQYPFVLKCLECNEISYILETFANHIQEQCNRLEFQKEFEDLTDEGGKAKNEGIEKSLIKVETITMEVDDPLVVKHEATEEFIIKEEVIAEKNLVNHEEIGDNSTDIDEDFNTDDVNETDEEDGQSSRNLSNGHEQHLEENLELSPQQVNFQSPASRELLRKLDLYKDTADKQHNNLLEILTEHKALLKRILNQNKAVSTIPIDIFPINSEEQLREFDDILALNSKPYIRQIILLLDGNAECNLHRIFGQNIIMNFNIEGNFGKKGLRDYTNVFKTIISVLSTFSESSVKTLRAAFQRQKKKYFKQLSRNKTKHCEKQAFEDVCSNKD